MNEDINELIRNAKPQVDPALRGKIRGHVEAHGAAASNPGSLVLLLRAAALVALAIGAGVGAAIWNAPEPERHADSLSDEIARVSALEDRVYELQGSEAETSVDRLETRLRELELEREAKLQKVVSGVVGDVIVEREQRELERWRERHLQHSREHWKRHTEDTIVELRQEQGLTAAQEQEVRALLEKQGEKAETLIAETYELGHKRRGHHDLHKQFAQLSRETDEKLSALMNGREGIEPPRGILASDPEDWAPTEEFEDSSDIDAWVYWMNQSSQQE